jgi:hypothetical protein
MNILELEILTNNLYKTEKFYTEFLGLTICLKDENFISFLAGQSILTFTSSEEVNPTYHFAFNIPHNKFDEAVVWACAKFDMIKNHDNEIVTDFVNWNAKSVYFYDNNNNVLELIARFDLPNTSEDPFTGSSIQSISEVGIVTDEPLVFGEHIAKAYGVPFYSRGPKREDFAAMGNDEGLFVISQGSRNWYPTNHRAEKHATKIKIASDNTTHELSVNQS